MIFCPECGSTMRLETEGDTVVAVCGKCGFRKEKSESTITESHEADEKVTVVDADEELEGRATVEIKCPECGHEEALTWTRETRTLGGGQHTTQFFRCKECEHTWRR